MRTVTLSRPAAVLAILFGLAMIGLLGYNAYDIERQRRIAARQEGRVKTAIELLDPAVANARRVAPAFAIGLERADRLVRGLSRGDAPRAIAAAGELARGFDRVDAAGALSATGNVALALAKGDRAVEFLDRATALVRRTGAADTVGDVDAIRSIAADLLPIARDVQGSQHAALRRLDASLRVQRRTLSRLEESLGIQRELLRHTRNLDRKLGGEAPSRLNSAKSRLP